MLSSANIRRTRFVNQNRVDEAKPETCLIRDPRFLSQENECSKILNPSMMMELTLIEMKSKEPKNNMSDKHMLFYDVNSLVARWRGERNTTPFERVPRHQLTLKAASSIGFLVSDGGLAAIGALSLFFALHPPFRLTEVIEAMLSCPCSLS